MINQQSIPCPICRNHIPFEVNELLKGAKFTCSNCQSVVALSSESVEETKNVIKKYEKLTLKSKLKKNKHNDKF